MSYTEEQELVTLCTKMLMLLFNGYIKLSPAEEDRRHGIDIHGTLRGYWPGDLLSLLKATWVACRQQRKLYKFDLDEINNLLASSSFSDLLEKGQNLGEYKYEGDQQDPDGSFMPTGSGFAVVSLGP